MQQTRLILPKNRQHHILSNPFAHLRRPIRGQRIGELGVEGELSRVVDGILVGGVVPTVAVTELLKGGLEWVTRAHEVCSTTSVGREGAEGVHSYL